MNKMPIYNFTVEDFDGAYIDNTDCPVCRLAKRENLTQNPSVSVGSLSDHDSQKYWEVINSTINGEDSGLFTYGVYQRVKRLIKAGGFKEATVEINQDND